MVIYVSVFPLRKIVAKKSWKNTGFSCKACYNGDRPIYAKEEGPMDRMDCIKTHIICQCAPSVGVCAVCIAESR